MDASGEALGAPEVLAQRSRSRKQRPLPTWPRLDHGPSWSPLAVREMTALAETRPWPFSWRAAGPIWARVQIAKGGSDAFCSN